MKCERILLLLTCSLRCSSKSQIYFWGSKNVQSNVSYLLFHRLKQTVELQHWSPIINHLTFQLKVLFPCSHTPPSLRQRFGLPPLCAFSLWFYDRSARLNSFFTYVKYITLPIIWIQTTYNKSVYKYFSDDKQWESKSHALNPVCDRAFTPLRWNALIR